MQHIKKKDRKTFKVHQKRNKRSHSPQEQEGEERLQEQIMSSR